MEDVVVVGAGWAGLAAASELVARGLDPLVLDQRTVPGGAASTAREGPWVLEAGPHALFPQEPAMERFLAQMPDAAARLVPASPASGERYLLKAGRRVPLPRSPPSVVRSPLLTHRAKLRLLAEPLLPRRDAEEESVARFTQRRFGRGVRDVVDAMVTGVFAGDPERLAARLALPRLVAAERRHGSVLRGLRRDGTPPRGTLSAPQEGMGPWLQGVAKRFRVRHRVEVVGIAGAGPFALSLRNGSVSARRVVLAVPPEAAARIMGVGLTAPPVAPVATVGLGWSGVPAVAKSFQGYGVLNPEREGRFTLGTLYESSLFPARAPSGGTLVRVLVGGRRHPERVALPDEELVARALEDVAEVHDVQRTPDWAKVLRPPPIPQLELGHEKRLIPLQDVLSTHPQVASAGWGWEGVGIADAVRSGQAAVRRLLRL